MKINPIKTLRLTGFCLLLLLGLSAFVYISNPGPLTGKWVETWGDSQSSDVSYHDVFIIRPKGSGGMSISCTTHTYQFEDIRFDGHILSFVLVNGGFKIPYRLGLSNDQQTLIGTAVDIHQKTTKIRWRRSH